MKKTIHTGEDSTNCNQKNKCIKGNNCKTPLEDRVKNPLEEEFKALQNASQRES
nr:hypothetical protein [Clostridium pasteurianum]